VKPPRFWSNPPDAPGWQARMLSPLAALAAAATRARVARPPSYRAPVPVICIGNAHLGGTGKTPAAMALAQMLQARGRRPAIVSRGYGGRLAGPVRVDERRHRADEVGDEPLLLAAFAPVWVSKDRAAGAAAAVADGADVLILDDGLQNPSVARDAAILTVNAAEGFGNARVAPAGPLREPVAEALARVDLVLATGDPAAQAKFRARWPAPVPVVAADLAPLETGMDWQGLDAVAFAGIARPERFFAALERLGVRLYARIALDDHQPLPDSLLRRIEAQAAGRPMVTTEKDAVRLPPVWRARVLTLPVRLTLPDAAPVEALLSRLGL
jgi:tetraacyldisaccharide 4'-kinase